MKGLFALLLRSKPQRMQSPLHLSQSQSHSFLFTSMVANKSYLYRPNLCSLPNFPGLLSNLHYFAHFSTTLSGETWKETGKSSQLEIEIISEENIKPASPTPDHLKTYEVSIIDQLLPNIYVPFIYFYPNNINNHQDVNLIPNRRQLLKQSLSETLTRFYPLAGKVKDSRHIDCNDDGAYYVEAKSSNLLSDFLKQPDDNKSINNLLPFDPNNSIELFSKTYVVMIQVTVFGCGGIAIGLYTSHKIIDGYSHATFLKAWAAAARGCSENNIQPSFISPSIFPSIPTLPADATMLFFPPFSRKNKRARFVFRESSITTLKKKAAASSRVMAVTGLIWKCAMAASSKACSKDSNCDNIPRSSVLSMAVNIRERSLPPMPPYTMGNIILNTALVSSSAAQYSITAIDDLRLNSIIQRLKNSIDFINSDFIEKIQGKEGSVKVVELLNETKLFHSKENTDYIMVNSTCNGGIYEADFGWGGPIWVSVGRTDTDASLLTNVIVLMDTRSRKGIEAWVTLREEEMAFLERDPELLAYASLNPSPLKIVDW
ncbi:hypothetical protein ACJIZ3_001471 [Penstemon smallii]|uniref:Uncharacterized protein n=1 Tax=Penstemon smallii TaxID=265156 RepID=A0ABD3U7A4_9LAMI